MRIVFLNRPFSDVLVFSIKVIFTRETHFTCREENNIRAENLWVERDQLSVWIFLSLGNTIK